MDQTSIPYIVSNVIAALIVIAAIVWPTFARILLSVIFIAAFAFNLLSAVRNPALYLEFAKSTNNELYRSIILGPFSRHIGFYITAMAIGQLLIGVFVCYRGLVMKLAMAGGIVFLLAISPLGFGAAFPCTLILSLALFILIFRKIASNIYDTFGQRQYAESQKYILHTLYSKSS